MIAKLRRRRKSDTELWPSGVVDTGEPGVTHCRFGRIRILLFATSRIMTIQAHDGLESTLVEQARAGDAQARSQVLTILQPLLRAYFIKRIGPRTDVDDLVQNTLLRIHNGLVDLKDVHRLKAFAMKAALFELQDLYRGRYGPKERLYDPETPPEPGTGRIPDGLGMDLERAMARLTPRARQIVVLREYGYRYEEIAQMIGSTEAAVKMQVKRAFAKMRNALVSLVVSLYAAWYLLAG